MKVAFYLMNSKGWFVLQDFLKKFGGTAIEYVVSAKDSKLQNDYFCEIKKLTDDNNIQFYDRPDFSAENESQFKGYRFSIGWRWLIQNEEKLIVFHDSLLPKYRGFAPLVNSLINGERRGGVTALFANAKYDCGDIIAQRSIGFDYPLKIQDAIEKVEPLYAELVAYIYQKLLCDEKIKAAKQDDSRATYSSWLDEEDYFINWQWSAEKIERFVNAVGYPYARARAKLGKELVFFDQVEEVQDLVVEHRERHIGKVLLIENGCPVVICKEGMLKFFDIRNIMNEKVHVKFRSRFS